MKQLRAVRDAPAADDEIDGLAESNALGAQGAVERCSSHRLIDAKHRYEIELPQRTLNGLGFAFRWHTQQDFAEDHVADDQRLYTDERAKLRHLRRGCASQVIDPNRAIDDDHAARPRRSASRSPSHAILPPRARMDFWRCSLMRSRNPSSTTAFLVGTR